MSANLSLGIIIGSALSGSFGNAFRSAGQRANQLGQSLNRVRLGRGAAEDVTRLTAEMARLRAEQARVGNGDAALNRELAETERLLNRARQAAGRYGVDLNHLDSETDRLRRSEQQLGAQLARSARLRDNQSRRGQLGGAMLGTAGMAIGAAYAVAQPMRQSLSFEHELRLFGNVVNFNNTQLGETKTQLKAIAAATNQTPGELLSALNTLAAKGLDPKLAQASLNIIGKTATAAGADVNELAATAFTLIDAMGLSPDQLPKAMDMLAQAGKNGSFELKDMATYFPQLTAQAKSLGITGTQGIATMGAALQIAMKGASDPAQAANNFQNFLTKLTSKETVKNFKKMGVDVQAVMTEATKKGADPVIAMVEKIQEITGGNKFKMSELFSDMQVIGFLNPMLANLDEFNRIKKDSLAANGVINKDYANMMTTGTEQLKAAGIEAQKLGETLGSALGPALKDIATSITPVMQSFGLWAENNKPLIATVVSLGFGMLGLKLAILATAWTGTVFSTVWTLASGAMAFFSNAMIGTRLGLAALSVQAFAVGAAQKIMAVWTGTVTAAQWLWNAALSANPIGLVVIGITAFGALAFAVYKNWQPIMAWFRENFAWLGTAVEKISGYAGKVGGALATFGKFMTTPAIGSAGVKPLSLPTANAALPAMSGGKQPQSVMYSTKNTIHVTQKPGEDGNALADRIVAKIERKAAADKRGALHD